MNIYLSPAFDWSMTCTYKTHAPCL